MFLCLITELHEEVDEVPSPRNHNSTKLRDHWPCENGYIQLFSNLAWSRGIWFTWLNDCGSVTLTYKLAKNFGHYSIGVEIKLFVNITLTRDRWYVIWQIRANVVKNQGSSVVTNWTKCYAEIANYYKLGQVLQIRTNII